MTEIAHITSEVLPSTSDSVLAPPAANIAQSRADQLAALESEAKFLDIAFGLAEKACSGALVAQHFRGKPADGAIAIAYGASLGWHWTKSLQDVYVVNGKPSIMAKEMRELMIRAGHEIWEETVGPTKVELAGRRRGSDIVVRVEWTIEKAEKAGYTKSNPNYQKIPESMLYARCTTDLAKRLAPDALSGLGIVEDMQDRPVRVVSEQVRPPRRGVAGLKAALAPASDPQPTAEPDPPVVEYATRAQQKRISDLLDGTGVTEKDAKLAYLREQFGDGIKSAADITAEQAAQLIVFLEQPEDPDAA